MRMGLSLHPHRLAQGEGKDLSQPVARQEVGWGVSHLSLGVLQALPMEHHGLAVGSHLAVTVVEVLVGPAPGSAHLGLPKRARSRN